MQYRLYFIFGAFLILELYIYQGVKNITQNTLIRYSYLTITTILYLVLGYFSFNFNSENFSRIATLSVIFLIPKLLGGLFLFIDDLLRLGQFSIQFFSSEEKFYPERRKFLSLIAIGSSAILAGVMTDGFFFWKI